MWQLRKKMWRMCGKGLLWLAVCCAPLLAAEDLREALRREQAEKAFWQEKYKEAEAQRRELAGSRTALESQQVENGRLRRELMQWQERAQTAERALRSSAMGGEGADPGRKQVLAEQNRKMEQKSSELEYRNRDLLLQLELTEKDVAELVRRNRLAEEAAETARKEREAAVLQLEENQRKMKGMQTELDALREKMAAWETERKEWKRQYHHWLKELAECGQLQKRSFQLLGEYIQKYGEERYRNEWIALLRRGEEAWGAGSQARKDLAAMLEKWEGERALLAQIQARLRKEEELVSALMTERNQLAERLGKAEKQLREWEEQHRGTAGEKETLESAEKKNRELTEALQKTEASYQTLQQKYEELRRLLEAWERNGNKGEGKR